MIEWGDVATWVTGAATLALFMVGLRQINVERTARNLREQHRDAMARRDQAEHLAAWIIGEEEGKVWVALSNASACPVYQAVVGLVLIQGSGPREAKDLPENEKRPILVVPPGMSYIDLPGGYGGMNRCPGIEIGFKDKAGRYWIRNSSGSLREIDEDVVEYYGMSRPLGWLLPVHDNPVAGKMSA